MSETIQVLKKSVGKNKVLEVLDELTDWLQVALELSPGNQELKDLSNEFIGMKSRLSLQHQGWRLGEISWEDYSQGLNKVTTPLLDRLDHLAELTAKYPELELARKEQDQERSTRKKLIVVLKILQDFLKYDQEDIEILLSGISVKINLPTEEFTVVNRERGSLYLSIALPSIYALDLYVKAQDGELSDFFVESAEMLEYENSNIPEKGTENMFLLQPTAIGDLIGEPIKYFGPEEETDPRKNRELWAKGLDIKLLDTPIWENVSQIYQEGFPQISEYEAIFFRKYKVILLVHRIKLNSWTGEEHLDSWGLEIQFDEQDLLFPMDYAPRQRKISQSAFHVYQMNMFGQFQLESVDVRTGGLPLISLDEVEFHVSDQPNLIGAMTFPPSPFSVSLSGAHSDRTQWHFFPQEGESVIGSQVCVQTIVVPKQTTELFFLARGFALVHSQWMPITARLQTDWKEVIIKI